MLRYGANTPAFTAGQLCTPGEGSSKQAGRWKQNRLPQPSLWASVSLSTEQSFQLNNHRGITRILWDDGFKGSVKTRTQEVLCGWDFPCPFIYSCVPLTASGKASPRCCGPVLLSVQRGAVERLWNKILPLSGSCLIYRRGRKRRTDSGGSAVGRVPPELRLDSGVPGISISVLGQGVQRQRVSSVTWQQGFMACGLRQTSESSEVQRGT